MASGDADERAPDGIELVAAVVEASARLPSLRAILHPP